MAVLNNFETDVKVKCIEEGTNQQKLGKAIGSTGQYLCRLVKKSESIVNKTFVRVMDELCYDIVVTYKKREEKPDLEALLKD